jgi:DNA polymerase III subunit alpha
MIDFCHLHSHTQYSLLDGASDIKTLMKKAKSDGQSAVAITDHGNMFGVFKFVKEAKAQGIKPIIGCEFYVTEDRHIKHFEKARGQKDTRYHQLMLAKNVKGYQNLTKLCSLGFTEGLYGKYPRIDKELIEKYHEGIIATSCCLGAEIPQTILTGNLELAEERLRWWLDLFGEDYYIELQRHRGLEKIDDTGMSQEDVNQVLIQFAKKYNVKTIVTNDSHYVEQDDFAPHDVLLCVNTGSHLEDKERFKFPSSDFYFKTKAEMNTLFGDVKEAVANTMEIESKIDHIELARDILLPAFPLPAGFDTQELFLRHLSFEGARKKYGTITKEVEDRLNFELDVITKSGYSGYFLIVQDFTSVARQMGVSVGPGRGSAAGSCVAYCLGITNIDPILSVF